MENKTLTIVLTGGGTAGHVVPHFALFDSDNSLSNLYKRDLLKVYYIGSHNGMEKNLVKKNYEDWNYCPIFTGKLRRYFSVQNFIDPFKIILGFMQCFFLLGRIKPAVVFSKGGFVSVPIVWCAWLRKIPVVIHESDVTPALATKLTLPFSKYALFAFDETLNRISSKYVTKSKSIGLPIRRELFSAKREDALRFFGFKEGKQNILIFGGSLGAQSLNAKMFEALPKLLSKYQVIHITGKGNARSLATDLFDEEFKNYRQYEFLNHEMKYAYAIADLAVCRAGANSIFELLSAKIPMILFPLGLASSRGDQIVNAKTFAKKGWAQWIDESAFEQARFLNAVNYTMENIQMFKEALLTAPNSDAADKVSELLFEVMGGHREHEAG